MPASTTRPGMRPVARPGFPARGKSGHPPAARVESPPMTPWRQLVTLIEKDLLFKLLLALLAYSLVPLGEIFFFLYVASLVGNYLVLVLAAVVGVIGAFVGISQARRVAARLKAGTGPDAAVEMAGLIVAGILLVTPGFLTDLAGVLLLVPALRLRVGRWAASRLKERAPRLYASLGLSVI